jgi:hypothetical protein
VGPPRRGGARGQQEQKVEFALHPALRGVHGLIVIHWVQLESFTEQQRRTVT